METLNEIQSPKYYPGLISYFKVVMARRTSEKLNCFNYDIALKHLENFANQKEVDILAHVDPLITNRRQDICRW
jgi:hypothetical protein